MLRPRGAYGVRVTSTPQDPPREPAAPTRAPAAPLDRTGLLLGVGAYVIWGITPLFFPLLEPAGTLEIIAHRIVWSLIFCVVLLAATGTLRTLGPVVRDRRTLGLVALGGVLVGVNWTTYVYGVLTDRVLDAALGYFINPILTILLAVVVLRERLRPLQWAAVGLGVLSVVVISTGVGGIPWIALTVALSFALYGLLKNRTGRSVGALPGLAVETAVLTPAALVYLGVLFAQGTGTFSTEGAGHALLLMSCGVITGLPLLLFGASARRIPLSVVGMLQYLGPLLQFVVGAFVLHEPMPGARWAGFVLVWCALILLTADALRAARATRLAGRTTVGPADPEPAEGETHG